MFVLTASKSQKPSDSPKGYPPSPGCIVLTLWWPASSVSGAFLLGLNMMLGTLSGSEDRVDLVFGIDYDNVY